MKHNNITERSLIVFTVLSIGILLSPVGTLAAPAGQEPIIHVVRQGETLSRIAGRYGVSVAALIQANGITNPDRIYAGQSLTIPVDDNGAWGTTTAAGGGSSSYTGSSTARVCDTYTVRLGDTLSKIARQYGVTVSSLQQANGLWNTLIWPFLKLKIPCDGYAHSSVLPTDEPTLTPAQNCPANGRYQVRPGDTLYTIARRCNTSVAALKAANDLQSEYLWVGQWLIIPETPGPAAATSRPVVMPTATPTEAYRWNEPATPTPTPTEAYYRWDEPAVPTLPPVSTPTPTPTPTPAATGVWAMPTPSG